jgi:hypothetical protein
MKAAEKSRFGKLVAYLLDPQGKKTRVGEVSITNCISTDTTWAVREITATQRLNARAISDRTYHLLVSLRAGGSRTVLGGRVKTRGAPESKPAARRCRY